METLKERHGCVTFWLWIVLIVNIVMFFYYIVAMFTVGGVIGIVGHGLSTIMCLGCILGAILLMRWNKLGFFLFLICQTSQVLLDVFLFDSEPYLIVSLVLAMCIWRGILQIRRNGVSAWENMSTGWDYQHCRHLYQVFLGLTFFIFILILFAVVNDANSGIEREDSEEYELLDSIAVDTVAVEVIDSVLYDPEPPAVYDDTEKADLDTKDPDLDTEDPDVIFLKRSVQEIKLPIDAGNGVVITNVYVDSENLVYIAECDEDKIDMDLLKASKREAKNNIVNSLKDNSNEALIFSVKMCIKARRGMCYRYVGDTSGKECKIVIPIDELRDLLTNDDSL
ncbi:hypothetical protein [Bacteroides sp. OF04-15BH]|uniref:hypothetical protein n=1 Tax=Bacteroides sp. OF04-15BH TaxID=2292281 RepID=UPI000E4F8772|nr:hypothetical protein [Bacteroides sp. OF04-15BH]RHP61522.1 hypothetical protein DXA74_13225 [Bacteroides sp. OF04-15BH]